MHSKLTSLNIAKTLREMNVAPRSSENKTEWPGIAGGSPHKRIELKGHIGVPGHFLLAFESLGGMEFLIVVIALRYVRLPLPVAK